MSKDLIARLEDRLRDKFDASPMILAQDDVGGLRVQRPAP